MGFYKIINSREASIKGNNGSVPGQEGRLAGSDLTAH